MTDTVTPPTPRIEVWASNSSLNMHRNCPQQWYYAHVRHLERLTDLEPIVERDIGAWWHALLAADSIMRGRKLGSLQVEPAELRTTDQGPTLLVAGVDNLVVSVLLTAKQWWDDQSPQYHEDFIERIGQDLPNRLRYAFLRWRERWLEAQGYEQPLAVELRWERQLPIQAVPVPGAGGHSTQWMDALVTLVGFADEVYFDQRRNLVVVRDHKMRKNLSTQTAADDMMDSQNQLYAWGLESLVKEWGVGTIQATQYDRVKMTAPLQPQLTLQGNLSKSVTSYDLYTYRKWAEGPDGKGVSWGEQGAVFSSGPRKGQPKYGLYKLDPTVEEQLARPDEMSIWHQRTLTPLNANIIAAHLRAAFDSAMDMARSRERAVLTHEAPRNLGPACRWCDFMQLCRLEMFGGADADVVLEDVRLRIKPEKVHR